MASITLKNPVANSIPASISFAQGTIQKNSQSLSTGVNANNDVVSLFLGKGLSDEAKILGKISSNLSYGQNILQITQNSLNDIANTLSDMLAIVAQATGNSTTNLQTLNSILQQKMTQVAQQTSGAAFDGRALLTGGLGSNPAMAPAYTDNAVTVRTIPATSTTTFLGAGTAQINYLTVGANTAAGEIVYVSGVGFTAVAAGTTPTANQFVIGSSTAATAENLVTAILNNGNLALQSASYSVNVATAVVSVTQNSPSTTGIPITGSANIAATINTAGISGGFDLSGIKSMPNFIGAVPTVNFTVLQQLTGVNAAALAATYGSVGGAATVAAAGTNAGDLTAAFSVTIGGSTFEGAIFQANAAGNLNNAQLKMIDQTTGQYFTITAGTAYAGSISNAANAALVAGNLNTLLQGTTFAQTQYLAIDTSGGNILNNSGGLIGSTTSMTASFTSTNFNNKEITAFTIGAGTNPGDVMFTATINGLNYTNNVLAANIPTLVQGFDLKLTNAVTNDTLSLNLGQGGLTSLATVANQAPIATAIFNALTNVGEGLNVRVGMAPTDIVKVTVSNVSGNQIYLDQNKNYVPSLSVLDQNNAAIAQTVLSNALNLIRTEQASVQSQAENLDEFSNSINTLIGVTKDASDGYLEADLIESAAAFSEALKKVLAAISTLQAGNRVADAGLQVIQQASQ